MNCIDFPWLLLFSQATFYKWIRITGSALAGIAAVAWIMERSSGYATTVSRSMTNVSAYAMGGFSCSLLPPWLLYAALNQNEKGF